MAKSSSRRLSFTVRDASWHADGEEFAGGEHTIEKPSAKLVELAAAAHDAGALDVTEGLDKTVVQTQKAGEKAYAAAQADGSWREGHVVQVALDAIARDADADPYSIPVVLGDESPATVTVTTAGEILDANPHIVRPDRPKKRRSGK